MQKHRERRKHEVVNRYFVGGRHSAKLRRDAVTESKRKHLPIKAELRWSRSVSRQRENFHAIELLAPITGILDCPGAAKEFLFFRDELAVAVFGTLRLPLPESNSADRLAN